MDDEKTALMLAHDVGHALNAMPGTDVGKAQALILAALTAVRKDQREKDMNLADRLRRNALKGTFTVRRAQGCQDVRDALGWNDKS